MPIPPTTAIAACMLRALRGGRGITFQQLRDEVAGALHLSAADRAELLHPDGRETKFGNRAGHARTVLVRLGLAEQAARGAVQITRAGEAVLDGDRTPRRGVKNITSAALYRRLDNRFPSGDLDSSRHVPRRHGPRVSIDFAAGPEARAPEQPLRAEVAVVREPSREPHAPLVPGPRALGRSIVLLSGDPVPEGWSGTAEVAVTEADLAGRTACVDRLHREWSRRHPLVIRLLVDADALKRPRSWTVPLWQLARRFDPWTDRLLFLVWNNSYDGRGGRPPRWHWTTYATRKGAVATPEGPADIRLPGGDAAWVDGGPRRPWPAEVFGDQRVVHYLSVEDGSLQVTPALVEPSAGLAADQLAAVRHVAGAARVIAPAGSGKTRVLTERLRHLVVDRRYPRDQVVAVAYNKRAQEEMARRTNDFAPRVQTLNSLGWEILRTAQPRMRFIESEKKVRALVEQCCPPLDRRANTDPLAPYLEALATTRQCLLDPSDVETRFSDIPGYAGAFRRYREQLIERNLADFDEQLYRSLELLLADADLRRRWQTRCRHLLVDEFQDLTPLHLLVLRTLGSPALDVFGTGDDDQVIYGYTGADPRFLIDFPELFPGAATHALEVNYRCTPAVVTAASTLLTHNRIRLPKRIRAARTGDAARGFTILEHSSQATAATIVDVVGAWRRSGRGARDIAVLCRVKAGLLTPQVALHGEGIPAISAVGTELLQRTGVRSALAYIRLALHPDAMQTADLEQVSRRPSRGFTRELLDELSRRRSWTLQGLRALAGGGPGPAPGRLYGLIDDLRDIGRAVTRGGAAEVLEAIRRAGLDRAMRQLDAKSIGESHIDDLDSLAQLAQVHGDVRTFETWLRDQLSLPSDADGVTLATVHRVKGEEWSCVLVVDVREGILPHRRADDVEEERRVLHVAITRGRDEVIVLTDRARPSAFIDELRVPWTDAPWPGRPARSRGRSTGRPTG